MGESETGAVSVDNPFSSSVSSSSASAAAAVITRFQCVGRLRVLLALSSHPTPAADAATPAGAALSVSDVSESAACRLLSSPPSCKIVSACWSSSDRHVLTT